MFLFSLLGIFATELASDNLDIGTKDTEHSNVYSSEYKQEANTISQSCSELLRKVLVIWGALIVVFTLFGFLFSSFFFLLLLILGFGMVYTGYVKNPLIVNISTQVTHNKLISPYLH